MQQDLKVSIVDLLVTYFQDKALKFMFGNKKINFYFKPFVNREELLF